MQSEFNRGAAHMRDLVFSHIIAAQENLGNDETNPQYEVLQDFMEALIDRYGDMCQPFKG